MKSLPDNNYLSFERKHQSALTLSPYHICQYWLVFVGVWKDEKLLVNFLLSNYEERKEILQKLDKSTLRATRKIAQEKSPVFESNHTLLLKTIAKQAANLDYDSFDIFNSIFAQYTAQDIRSHNQKILGMWSVPDLLSKNQATECFGFAYKAHQFFQGLGLPVDLYTARINQAIPVDEVDHVAVVITLQDERILLEPFFNFDVPVYIDTDSTVTRRDNKTYSLQKTVSDFTLSRVDKNQAIVYQKTNPATLNVLLPKIFRSKIRQNLYVRYVEGQVTYIRYCPEKNTFESNVEALDGLPAEYDLIKRQASLLTKEFNSNRIVVKLLNFANIVAHLSPGYWI